MTNRTALGISLSLSLVVLNGQMAKAATIGQLRGVAAYLEIDPMEMAGSDGLPISSIGVNLSRGGTFYPTAITNSVPNLRLKLFKEDRDFKAASIKDTTLGAKPIFSKINPNDSRKGGAAYIPLTVWNSDAHYSLKLKGRCDTAFPDVGCAQILWEGKNGETRKMTFRDQNPPTGSGRIHSETKFGRLGASVFAKNASGSRYMGATFWLNEDQVINITRLARPMPGEFRIQFCVSGEDSTGRDLKQDIDHLTYERLDKKHGSVVVRSIKSKSGKSCIVANKDFYRPDIYELSHLYFRVKASYKDGRVVTMDHGLDWDGEAYKNTQIPRN